MTFVHPFATVLLALVAVPVVLYLLPMPRKRVSMPSLILWQRMLRDRPASQSWRWLRTLLSCLVQVFILMLLVVAVGKPVFGPAGAGAETAVLVLDVSASMKAPLSDDPSRGTRFDEARALAARIVEGMPSGHRVAVVTAGTSPTVVCGPTAERAVVLDRLKTLACTEGRTDLRAALSVALALVRGERSAAVTVLSDGAADVSDVALGDVDLQYYRIGTSVPNVGIVDFRARRGFDYPDECQALVRVHNAFSGEKQVALSLLMDNAVVATATVAVPPGETVERSFPDVAAGEKPIKLIPGSEGLLRVAIAGTDAFAVDDAATALLSAPEKTRVLLVSDTSDRFLKSVLKANLTIDAFSGTMKQYLVARPAADVVIFNGQLPPALPPGNLFIINPQTSCALFDVGDETTGLTPSDWQRDHPVLTNVTLKDAYVPAARTLKPKGWATVLADAGGTPLILAGRESGRRVLVMTFDPGKSSLSFRVAFPVLVADAFAWLSNRADLTDRETVSGGAFRLKPSTAVAAVDVTGPDGEVRRVSARGGELVIPAPEAGLYRTHVAGRDLTLAANLTDARESDLAVAGAMVFADRSVTGRDSGEAGFGEFWLIAAVAAFALLAVEWVLYHHRVVV